MSNEERFEKLSIRIYYLRKIHGLTQKELAEKAGISVHVLRNIEKPDVKGHTTITTLFNIADALGIEASELLA